MLHSSRSTTLYLSRPFTSPVCVEQLVQEPASITEAIKNSVEKVGIEHLKDKERVAICFHGNVFVLSQLTLYGKSLIYALLPYICL